MQGRAGINMGGQSHACTAIHTSVSKCKGLLNSYYNPNLLLIYVINITLFTLLVICMVSCQY